MMQHAIDSEITNDFVISEIDSIFSKMEDGQKITADKLIEKIKQTILEKNPKATMFHISKQIKSIMKNNKNITTEVGRCGGYYKGKKPPPRLDLRQRCDSCNQLIRK